jgi:hypothetical protein
MQRDELASPWWLLPPGRLHPWWWIVVGAGLIWIDYDGGSASQFPVLYVIPVALAAWYSGRWPAVALAVAVPLAHIIFLVLALKQPAELGTLAVPVGTTIFRGVVIVIMALWFARLSGHERAMHRHVQRLEGLLPICSFCKSIRNKSGDWEPLETFISTRSEAEFSHGFCTNCGKTHYPESYPAQRREKRY